MMSRLSAPQRTALIWAVIGMLLTVAFGIAIEITGFPNDTGSSALANTVFKILLILNIVPLLAGAALSVLPWRSPDLIAATVALLANAVVYGGIAWSARTTFMDGHKDSTTPPTRDSPPT